MFKEIIRAIGEEIKPFGALMQIFKGKEE